MSTEHKLDEEFKTFREEVVEGKYKNPLDVPAKIWGNFGWELLTKNELEELLLPFMRETILRAAKVMPMYKSVYKKLPKLESIRDVYSVPILVKDSTTKGIGFRNKISKNPYILLPSDIQPTAQVYKSGGTKGIATPTFITPLDREIESWGFARAFAYAGFRQGDRVLSTYNPTHKGGEIAKEAILKLGAIYIPKRLTDSSEELIKTIELYNVNAIIASQGPIIRGDKESKGGGTNLLAMIEAGHDMIEQKVEKIVLGGYSLIDEVISWSETFNKPIASLLGSSEAIPQAGSTLFRGEGRTCKYNNLHIHNGPHYVEVVKQEGNDVVPVKRGEKGLLVYTTIAREGTIYIRYAPGDEATLVKGESECECGLKSPIISNINRIDNPNEIISTGCCVG